jgi:hypothetical protein
MAITLQVFCEEHHQQLTSRQIFMLLPLSYMVYATKNCCCVALV